MLYYYICLAILLFFFFLLGNHIYQDLKQHAYVKYVIPYCLLLTLIFKFNYGIEFWGLEYEDAYSFSFCARQFSHNIYPSSFLIDAVAIGSLEEPASMFTYGGHFITYSTFLSIFTRPLGWSPQLIFTINTFVSFIILLILSLIGKNNKLWFLAPSLYCVAPIINVFTTCCLSEIFSSLVCLSFVYTYLNTDSKRDVVLCLTSFGLALLCKRENLALLFIPTLDIVISICKHKQLQEVSEKVKEFIPYFFIILIYLFGCQNIFNIERVEAIDIGQSTFSWQNFKIMFPLYIRSLSSLSLFSVCTYLYVAYIIYATFDKCARNTSLLLSMSMLILYMSLYASHYRGWFFLKGEEINEFDTFRYINNFFYFIPLAFCTFKVFNRKLIALSTFVLLSFSVYQTFQLRINLSNIEYESRFQEVDIVKEYLERQEETCMLICDNILLYQNKCDSNFSVCDITNIDFLKLDNNKYSYYVLLPEIDYLEERHNIKINHNHLTPVLTIPGDRHLYKYKLKE